MNILKKLNKDYPDDYIDLINRTLDFIVKKFNDDLISAILGGSGGKGNIIPGWSDIDLYIVLKRFDLKCIYDMTRYILKEDIHIGITYYLYDEVLNNIIDGKTKIMLYEKQNYNVNPTLFGSDNIFNKISYEAIKENDKNIFPNILHDLRRRYIDIYIDEDKKIDKVYIKKLLVLIKCILNYYNIFSYGYKETFEKFKKIYKLNKKYLNSIDNFDIMYTINNMLYSKDMVLEFTFNVFKFIEHNKVYKCNMCLKEDLL